MIHTKLLQMAKESLSGQLPSTLYLMYVYTHFSTANGVSDRHVIRREELVWGTGAFLIENETSEGHVISRKEVKF